MITGGAGFIGSNYVRWVLANTPDEVTVYDALTYAGNLASLRDVEESFGSRYRFVHANICDLAALEEAVAGHDGIVHFAAESHVDRSIAGPEAFALTNCVGTNLVMHAARRARVERVVHISTDEVYGSVEAGRVGRGGPARTAFSVFGVKGRFRFDRALVLLHLRPARARDAGRRTISGRGSSRRR